MHQDETYENATLDDDGAPIEIDHNQFQMWTPKALGPLCHAIWYSSLHSDCEESWCECSCHSKPTQDGFERSEASLIAKKFLVGVSETVYVKAGNIPGYIPYFHHLLVSGYADDSNEETGTYTINLAQIDRASYQPVNNVTNIILEYLTEPEQEEEII